MANTRLDNIRWVSTGSDPGIMAPANWSGRKSFARLVWGGPWLRPVSLWMANPWTEWRLFTIRLQWFAFPFISIRIGKLMFYIGAKTYVPGADHTYARPGDIGNLTATFSARLGWEPLS